MPVRTDGTTIEPASVSDLGAAAYRRISNLRSSLSSLISDTRAPKTVDAETRETIVQCIALGAAVNVAICDPDADGYVGHDFGTSTTKAIVRWPYDRSAGAFAVPVPAGWCSGNVPHLWPTVVYFDPASRAFAPLPGEGLVALTGFKSALIEGQGHRMCCGSVVSMADAATAFITLHLAYVLGAIAQTRPDAGISVINVGVPVAALADQKISSMFGNVTRAAAVLLGVAPALTLDDVHAALATSDQGSIQFELHTELSGAIAGYCAGPRPYQGAHVIVDCGSATLDIASFHLGNGPWPIGIYAAEVGPLGADACVAYQAAGAGEDDCRGAVRFQEHRVYADTLEFARSGFSQDDDRRYAYQVIMVGGGIDGPIHRSLFDDMAASFQRPFFRPELDRGLLRDAGASEGRLVLADGLARSPIELREVAMPGDRPPPQPHSGPEMISKDQV
ncbi:hypothetical protein [Sphingomonas panacisoli]|uniref:hypothetical protein n=1 Tax=Sphingomonas panacisoli TaxID=1813879 RepID=UPI001960F253|nr:hypothetical protein [Sphingomonas panacisoli]